METIKDKTALMPFVKIFSALAVGIVVGISIPTIFSVCVFVLLLFTTVLFFIAKEHRTLLSYLMLFMLGISLTWLQQSEPSLPLNTNIEKQLLVIDTTSKKEILICRTTDDNQKIAIIRNKKQDISIGDTINATIQAEELRFAHYTLKKVILDKEITVSAKIIGDEQIKACLGKSEKEKTAIHKRINKWCTERLSTLNIDKENIAIIDGMLLGNRQDIEKKQIEDYRAAGISHVLAISGMHISILFMLLNILFIFRLSSFSMRVAGSVLIIAILWIYTIIVGSPVSAVRATVMFSLMQISIIRIFSPLQIFNTLFATATLFVLVDYTLIWDLSFQLSFTAVLSILIFMPYFARITKKMPYAAAIIPNILFVSIAAQILTTPLILYYFGYFSTISLAANIAGTICITLIMILSIGYLIFPNAYIGTAIDYTFTLLNSTLDYLIGLPYSHIENIGFSKIDIVLYLLITFLVLNYINKYCFVENK